MRFYVIMFLSACISFPVFSVADDLVVSGADNTAPVFSATPVRLYFEPNSLLNVVDDDAVMIRGGSTVTLESASAISVINSISEGVGIHILAGTDDRINTITLNSGSSIRVETNADNSSEYTYSKMQGKSYMPLFPALGNREPIVSDEDYLSGAYSSVDYDTWEQNNLIDSYMVYCNAAARGIVLEGENYYLSYDSSGTLLTELPSNTTHTISLEDASIFVSSSVECTDCFCVASAYGVHVDLPETSNAVVELNMKNSHITAESYSNGSFYYDGEKDSCEISYVYGQPGPKYLEGSHNSVGVYAASDMTINVDSSSSISGDWAVWEDPGLCVGWYHG